MCISEVIKDFKWCRDVHKYKLVNSSDAQNLLLFLCPLEDYFLAKWNNAA